MHKTTSGSCFASERTANTPWCNRDRGRGMRKAILAAAVALAFVMVATPAGARHNTGFKTSQAAMLDPVATGWTAEPIITVGETLPGSTYKFESIPDGIALRKGHGNSVEAYVNHETSTVPFPLTPPPPLNDFTNALVSKLTLSRQSAG